MEQISEEQLISRAQAGDAKAFEAIVTSYLGLVYAFVYKYLRNRQDAEDATQEIFVKVWRNLTKFDNTKPLRPWLYKIAKNTCLDALKRKNPEVATNLETLENTEWLAQASDTPAPESSAEQSLLTGRLAAALAKLSPKYSEIVTLYHEKDLNFREIAEQKGESVNTIKSRYRRAIRFLRDLL